MRLSKSLYLSTFILLIPLAANADPKSDIAAYEKALTGSDITAAQKPLYEAFENAMSLPDTNAYRAKIAYDNAYFGAFFDDFSHAAKAIKIVNDTFNKNENLKKGSDLKELAFLTAYINYFANKNVKDQETLANQLDAAAMAVNDAKRSDYFLLNSNNVLANYYINDGNWGGLGRISEREFIAIDNVLEMKPEDKSFYLAYAYANRGQAKFVKQLGARVDTKFNGLLNIKKYPLWADALADIYMAEKLYGKSDLHDTFVATVDGWSGMINAYSESLSTEIYLKNIRSEIARVIDFDAEKYIGNPAHKDCSKSINIDYKFRHDFPVGIYGNYFGYVRALYDIDKEYKTTNVRILSAFPSRVFGNNTKDDILKSKIKVTGSDVPPQCLKDNIIEVQYIAKF